MPTEQKSVTLMEHLQRFLNPVDLASDAIAWTLLEQISAYSWINIVNLWDFRVRLVVWKVRWQGLWKCEIFGS